MYKSCYNIFKSSQRARDNQSHRATLVGHNEWRFRYVHETWRPENNMLRARVARQSSRGNGLSQVLLRQL